MSKIENAKKVLRKWIFWNLGRILRKPRIVKNMVCKSQKSFEEMVQPNKNIVLQESKKF